MFAELGVEAASFGDAGVGIFGGALDQDDEFSLALVGIGRYAVAQFAQGAVEHGLEQLGEFARQDRGTVGAEGVAHVPEAVRDAVRGFVEGQRARLRGQQRQALAARTGFRRQESLEHETVAG